MAIPKVLHQTVSDKTGLHPRMVASIEALRRDNPGWTHRLYEESDCRAFIAEAYGGDMLERYDRIKPLYGPARADLFRYLLLYKKGGVYLDVKSTATRPLDTVIREDDAFILSHWRNAPDQEHAGWGVFPDHPALSGRGEFQQWHVVAAPGHPFLAAVIDAVMRNIDHYDPVRNGVGKLAVVKMTGPIAYSLAIHPIKDRHPHRLVDAEDLGFVFSIFGTQGWRQTGLLPHAAHFKSHYSTATEPILFPAKKRSSADRVGRNDPCPCGSGKKFKQCHGSS